MKGGRPRARRDRNAEEPDRDGDHALAADLLAQEWTGEKRDEDRRQEGNRRGLRQLEVTERDDVRAGRAEQERRAQSCSHGRFERSMTGRDSGREAARAITAAPT